MKSDTFRVKLEKDNLVFSAAHFITFDGNTCESIHGHNYRVKCEVTGALDENGYVVDFIALRDALQEIVSRLDHHVVLPTLHPQRLLPAAMCPTSRCGYTHPRYT